MCRRKKLENTLDDETENMDEDSDSSDSITDSSEESESDNNDINIEEEIQESNLEDTVESNIADEEEDEVIQAIRRECSSERNSPPQIHCEDFITDLSFNPITNILAVASIVGDVLFYQYSNQENIVINTLELHTKACRDIEFSEDGAALYSTSKDKSIMITDVETGKLINFYENSHDVPVYCLTIIDENSFSTGTRYQPMCHIQLFKLYILGDDEGVIKIWDKREIGHKPIYKTKKNEDYISDMLTNESKQYLVCSSGDGSLTSIDLQNRQEF